MQGWCRGWSSLPLHSMAPGFVSLISFRFNHCSLPFAFLLRAATLASLLFIFWVWEKEAYASLELRLKEDAVVSACMLGFWMCFSAVFWIRTVLGSPPAGEQEDCQGVRVMPLWSDTPGLSPVSVNVQRKVLTSAGLCSLIRKLGLIIYSSQSIERRFKEITHVLCLALCWFSVGCNFCFYFCNLKHDRTLIIHSFIPQTFMYCPSLCA